MGQNDCCTPSRGQTELEEVGKTTSGLEVVASDRRPKEVVAIPGGTALVGTSHPYILQDSESPMRKVTIRPFLMDRTAVTNAEFADFVKETGYVTEAEKFGWSIAFHSHVKTEHAEAVAGVEWWRKIDGATWRLINGEGSEGDWYPDHPVVQVSWSDAQAYAQWAGGRLPTEAEWEHAARGGLGDVIFPWGNDPPNDTDFFPCNIWQGNFPNEDTGADGFTATAPARSFEPNPYGLFNMCGNTWEWTTDAFKIRSLKKAAKERAKEMRGFKTLKGGSFLCHISYCFRYRIAARTGSSPDSGTTHSGFRLVYNANSV